MKDFIKNCRIPLACAIVAFIIPFGICAGVMDKHPITIFGLTRWAAAATIGGICGGGVLIIAAIITIFYVSKGA